MAKDDYRKGYRDGFQDAFDFLNKKENRQLYSRLEKTDKGWGRVYLHFRWKPTR